MTSQQWRLRDVDNRDEQGAPLEVVAVPAALVPYVDVTVRADLNGTKNLDRFNELVQAIRDEDLKRARRLGKQFSLYLSEVAA